MAGQSGCSSSMPSLPPPCSKSPPRYPDLYGKRREIAKIQLLEREIDSLEEELKSVQGLQPISICCKEITDFVTANPDPLTPECRTNQQRCSFWKRLCGFPCFNSSWICCAGCSVYLEAPCSCSCDCKPCNVQSWISCCRVPKGNCFSCSTSSCCRNISCSRLCCISPLSSISCPGNSRSYKCKCRRSCKCSFLKCLQVNSCCSLCPKNCCNSHSLCC